MNIRLAHQLIQICAEVNEGIGVTLRCENVSCRVLLPDNVEMPHGIPEGSALVVFAGSNDWKDWIFNAAIIKRAMVPFGDVHGGFLSCYEKIQHALHTVLQMHRNVVFAGHSQGGAIAVLAAADFWNRGHIVEDVYTFGSPRPASERFREIYRAASLSAVTHRVVVGWDCVPRHPDSLEDYHVGVGHFFSTRGKRLKRQEPEWPWWHAHKWFWAAVDNHLAANEYTRALRIAAEREA